MSVKLFLHAVPNLWLFTLLMMCQIYALSGQQLAPVGAFDHHEDVGNPKLKGSVVYSQQEQIYTVSGAGANMWAKADQFHFLWKKIKGDFIIQATVNFIGL